MVVQLAEICSKAADNWSTWVFSSCKEKEKENWKEREEEKENWKEKEEEKEEENEKEKPS